MKLKELYEKLYNKIASVEIFKKLLKIPFVEKLLRYEVVSYLFFGALTTAVNFITYGLMYLIPGADAETKVLFSLGALPFKWIYLANGAAWVASALFAYVTNKRFVFESRKTDVKTVSRELVSFFGARVLSLVLFEELLFGFLGLFMNSWLSKVVVSVLVVIFNYVASKRVVFRKKGETGDA